MATSSEPFALELIAFPGAPNLPIFACHSGASRSEEPGTHKRQRCRKWRNGSRCVFISSGSVMGSGLGSPRPPGKMVTSMRDTQRNLPILVAVIPGRRDAKPSEPMSATVAEQGASRAAAL